MTSFDVFESVRVHAMRVGDECECIMLAQAGARSIPRTWIEHLESFDWLLTYFGRKLALEP